MRHEGETTRPGECLRQTTQVDGLAAGRASVLILYKEHLRPADGAVVSHTVHGTVDADALDAVHCLVVNGTLHPAHRSSVCDLLTSRGSQAEGPNTLPSKA